MDLEKEAVRRGRPRTRVASRDEQVRQNMRLYRARRAAELKALATALERLSGAVASGDLNETFRISAAVCGLWESGTIRKGAADSRPRPRRKRSDPD